ncbi:MAG: metallophosphoesterase [Erysipelotrichales bacterium]|nr:metallophosphoesterase [Erysipelotrichales bacterium]
MKILFLHLSDLHMNDVNTFTEFKINKMKDAINSVEKFDEAVVLFSGDVSFSGKKDQYCCVQKILSNLEKYFKDKLNSEYKLNYLIAPGNHDVDFDEVPFTRRKNYESIDKNAFVKKYLDKMHSFFDFAKKYNCFVKNRFLDVKYIDLSGFVIKVNLVNSAIFSTFCDEKDNDLGSHFFPQSRFENVLNDSKSRDLEITVMHHSLDYFDENSKAVLSEHMSKFDDVFFYGHEHQFKEEKSIANNNIVEKVLGGPLSKDGKHIFDFILLDTNTKIAELYKYTWNDETKTFDESKQTKFSVEKFLRIQDAFIKTIKQDDLLNELDDFTRIFEFPELEFINEEGKSKIATFKDFNRVLSEKSFCYIEGDDKSGKTTLSKYLFLKYAKDTIPVLFNASNIKNRSIHKIVNEVFNEEYDARQYNFNNFKQECSKDKIAIIDNVDKIHNEDMYKLLEEIKVHFNKIVLIGSNKSNYDINALLKEYNYEIKFCKIRICEMFSLKRNNLLTKVFNLLRPMHNQAIVETWVKTVNSMIAKDLNIFQLNPGFIVLFAKSALLHNFEFGAAKVFNTVFQSNITNIIQNDKTLDPSVVLVILQRVAYKIHTTKTYPISQTEFINTINEYNEEGKGYRDIINAIDFISRLNDIRLIKYVSSDWKIAFSYNSYLSFFIAKEILRLNDKDSIEKIVDNIAYGLNGDILLFLCYLSENNQQYIIDYLLKQSNSFFNPYEELSFEKGNIKYLLKSQRELDLKFPSQQEIHDKQVSMDSSERATKRSDKLRVEEIYEYDEEDATYELQILTGIKYIEMISKLLPDFIHVMNVDKIKKCVEAVYVYPNRFLYFLLKDIDENLGEIINDFPQIKSNTDSEIVINSDRIDLAIRKIQRISMFIVLNVYYISSQYASAQSTKKALNNFDYNANVNYKLINAMITGFLGDTKNFGNKIMDIYESSKDKAIRNMCKLIFRNYCLNNKINYVGENQSFVDKLLNKPQDNYISNTSKKMKDIRLIKNK